jgi:hypothetical protein
MTIPSKNWGGARIGAGRPSTGRKKRNFYITDAEYELIKQYLEQLRASSEKAANSTVSP